MKIKQISETTAGAVASVAMPLGKTHERTEEAANPAQQAAIAVNMKKAGIIDPQKVTKNALLNASSIAGTILLTECVVVDKPEDKKENAFDPSMMGMM